MILQNEKHDVMVSIRCLVYNHEPYLRRCLDGFVMQKTNFKFEAIVHDDASTDGSAAIIREYAEKYPDIIKPIFETENQYSKHDGSLKKIMDSHMRGKYIALCEGDDYWTDPLKLQKQVDCLEYNPQGDICATSALKLYPNNTYTDYSASNTDKVFTVEEVIQKGGGFVATASLLYRKNLNDNIPKFRQFFPQDYTIQIHGSIRGGMLYLAEKTSVYRVLSKDSWTRKILNDSELQRKNELKKNKMLTILNKETGYAYDQTITKTILTNEFFFLYKMNNFKELKEKKFISIYKKLSFLRKIYITLGSRMPTFITFFRKIFKR